MSLRPALLLVTTIAETHRAFLLPLARHFRSLGWRVDGMAAGITAVPECLAHYDQVYEISWSRNPLQLHRLARAADQVRQIVVRGRYHVVHVHTPVAAFLVRYALKSLRRHLPLKVVYTAHGFHFYRQGSPLKNVVFRVLEQLAGRWTDYLIVINREDEAGVRRYKIVSSEQLAYIPGIGVDTTAYAPSLVGATETARVRSELGLDDATPLFVMVAEFNPGKRHLDIVEALAQMKHRSAHLALAGDGPLLDAVRSRVRRLRLQNRVHFLGYRRDIPVLMRASTATVMPSEREGLNRSVMESLALEVPVIGTDARGIADLLVDGCGIVVPVGDIDALGRAMDWVIAHPSEARKMARVGRKCMAAHYDLRQVLNRHEEVYEQLLGPR